VGSRSPRVPIVKKKLSKDPTEKKWGHGERGGGDDSQGRGERKKGNHSTRRRFKHISRKVGGKSRRVTFLMNDRAVGKMTYKTTRGKI